MSSTASKGMGSRMWPGASFFQERRLRAHLGSSVFKGPTPRCGNRKRRAATTFSPFPMFAPSKKSKSKYCTTMLSMEEGGAGDVEDIKWALPCDLAHSSNRLEWFWKSVRTPGLREFHSSELRGELAGGRGKMDRAAMIRGRFLSLEGSPCGRTGQSPRRSCTGNFAYVSLCRVRGTGRESKADVSLSSQISASTTGTRREGKPATFASLGIQRT
mmetsp:Transcript_42709/g.91605  ORF Transcript_42709/g.91605 Transcript_42709/m.91605 type:complete len:215 (-) Transcript_42709:72-716(-)